MKIKVSGEDDCIETIEVDEILETDNGGKIAVKGDNEYYSPDGRVYFEINDN